ncbi:hypothetical protein SCLCIDRAFT_1219549 [Scleroderma citrinum Foug A]|uniref:IRG-type G domain-containing protein n=1 Tax=Scleroderma citrinum Foug A TaxID=1036808 RepID=A0A0C3DMS5_9AGAM|nr:hypothetical protein SCLCIDRAFT_1219549 [Scleroderma citrinum Foug A]
MGPTFSNFFYGGRRAREAEERARNAEEAAREARTSATEACRHAAEMNEKIIQLMDDMQKMQVTDERTKALEERMKKMEEMAQQAAEQAEQSLRRMAEADENVRKAQEEAGRATAKKNEILQFYEAGIQPADIPSEEEIQAMKNKIQYDENVFHIAIAGVSGSGKSSLINAFRGLRSTSSGAAPTGVIETTTEMARYPPSNSEHPLAWFDIPGAGTHQFSGWKYFKKQGLYAFDAIIVLFDGRFTETDITILENCSRLDIPSFIVRSKADVHIHNIIVAKQSDDEEEDEHDPRRLQQQYGPAKSQLVEQTQASVKLNLKQAKLSDQRVYIVSANNLQMLIKNKKPHKVIDEIELVRDVYLEALARRASDALDSAVSDLARWEGVSYRKRHSNQTQNSNV